MVSYRWTGPSFNNPPGNTWLMSSSYTGSRTPNHAFSLPLTLWLQGFIDCLPAGNSSL